jgi:hypothetical protein
MPTIKEKIEAAKNARSVMGLSVSFDAPSISKTLEIDEILSDDYEQKLLPVITSHRFTSGDTNAHLFIAAMEGDIGTRIADKFTQEERKRLVDKYIRLSKESSSVNIRNLRITDGIEGYLMSQLIATGSVDVFLKSDPANMARYLDDAMLNSNYATVKALYDGLSKKDGFEYNNWPIVIINGKLGQSQKIEMIKATFRQKDVNKYTEYIRNNMTDLDDLDSFIEATIMQNNRVTEKDRNVVDIVKRIFVGVRGKNYSLDMSKFSNKDKFFDKYRKYFMKPNLINTMAEDESSYYSRRNSVNFLSALFAKLSFAEKLDIVKHSPRLGSEMIDDSKTKELTPDILNDPKTQRAFCEYMIAKDEGKIRKIYNNYGKENTLMLIRNNPEIFAKPVAKSIKISSSNTGWGELDAEESIDLLLSLDDEFVSRSDFRLNHFNQRCKMLGFLKNEDNSWRTLSSLSDFYKERLPGISIVLKSERLSKALKNKIYEVFFSQLEDEDFANGDLLNQMSSIISEQDFMNEAGGRIVNNPRSASDVIDAVVAKYKGMIQSFYPDKLETISENLDKLSMSLKVIAGV